MISTIRMSIQLLFTGYLLVYIFSNPFPFITILIILIMEIFASYTIIKKFKGKISTKLKKIVFISMFLGTLFSIFYFLLIIVRISPWYNPQYFIPISGMLIGNSMTGISLAANKLIDDFNSKKNLINGALMLGATPKDATKEIVNSAFDCAIMPTINSMLGMGIIFLPGMMTGQILSGVIPTTAINYQIAIMLGILSSVCLTVILFVTLGYKTFFNVNKQLKICEK